MGSKNLGRKIIYTFIEFFDGILVTCVRFVPGYVGNRLRYLYYKAKLKSLGKGVIIDVGVYMLGAAHISIGDSTWIDKNVILIAGKPDRDGRVFIRKENRNYTGEEGELIIGKGCHVAPYTVVQAHGGVKIGSFITLASGSKIYSMSHHYRVGTENGDKLRGIVYKFSSMAPPAEQCLTIGAIVMRDSSALGLNSVILPGATIGENSWVSVNSSVVNDILPDSIAAGNPAIVVKERFPEL